MLRTHAAARVRDNEKASRFAQTVPPPARAGATGAVAGATASGVATTAANLAVDKPGPNAVLAKKLTTPVAEPPKGWIDDPDARHSRQEQRKLFMLQHYRGYVRGARTCVPWSHDCLTWRGGRPRPNIARPRLPAGCTWQSTPPSPPTPRRLQRPRRPPSRMPVRRACTTAALQRRPARSPHAAATGAGYATVMTHVKVCGLLYRKTTLDLARNRTAALAGAGGEGSSSRRRQRPASRPDLLDQWLGMRPSPRARVRAGALGHRHQHVCFPVGITCGGTAVGCPDSPREDQRALVQLWLWLQHAQAQALFSCVDQRRRQMRCHGAVSGRIVYAQPPPHPLVGAVSVRLAPFQCVRRPQPRLQC